MEPVQPAPAAEPPPTPAALLPALPEPVVSRRAHYSLWLVWLVPLVAVAIGVGLGVKAVLKRGPQVTIQFRSAEGLEAGKTRIRYKDVNVGLVKSVRLSPDRKQVDVTAELNEGQDLESLLVTDTRFWVVRPRVGVGGITGLTTLLSGVYIGMDAGRAEESESRFQGLDVQPIITAGAPGRQFVLQARQLGSLDIGSSVYFRRVPVGQVLAYELAPDGRQIVFTIFVSAPYDRLVNTRSRFWHASGVELALDADGIRLSTQGLASVIAGGIAFQDLPDMAGRATSPAAEGARFTLHEEQAVALRQPDSIGIDYRLVFSSSVRGLSVGAPVDYRGLPVGEVTRIGVEGTAGVRNPKPRVAVDIRVYPSRLRTNGPDRGADAQPPDQRGRLDPMVAHGFRAQLRSGNLLTGQLFVALDFFPEAPPARMDWRASPPTLPVVPGSLDSLQDSLTRLAKRLERLPLETLAQDVHRTLATLEQSLKNVDQLVRHIDNEVPAQAGSALQEARAALADVRKTLATIDPTTGAQAQQTLAEMARAARSLRGLADTLERHPESLLKGKPEDPK